MDVGIEDVGVAVLQEMWNKVTFQAMDLVSQTRDVVLNKDRFQQFSRTLSELSNLLKALDAKNVEAAMGSEFTKVALMTLTGQLMKAHQIVRDYKTGSHLRLLLQSHSILLQMEELAKEIATTIASFQLVNLDIALSLKTMTNQIISNLTSMEFRSTVAMESIALEIENSMSQNARNQENAVKLLDKIAEVVGVGANASLIQNELILPKQEKEEMEDKEKQAEALQLSQLMQLLHSTETVSRAQEKDSDTRQKQYPINSFRCPLCKEMMTDPVAIFCGHSFERKAIQDHFDRGEKNCPTCREELSSLELTPNIILRSSVEEWKQRDMELKFQAALSAINCNDSPTQNTALEDLQIFMERPQYAVTAIEKGIIPKLVEFLNENRLNTTATLKCLYLLAKHSDNHKEAMVEAGVVRRIVKQIYRSDKIHDVVTVLLELSKHETLTEKIGNTRDCIPLLVSMLENNSRDISEKAKDVLENLSSNTSFVVKMAEAGYFKPFVARFIQGPQESRAWMANDFLKMQLREQSLKDLKDKKFIESLTHMLSSNNSALKLVSLGCIKKLITHRKMSQQILSDNEMILQLLGVISLTSTDVHLKQEAGEILARLVEACQHPQFEMHQGLRELQSEHSISLFMELVISSDPQVKIQFLHLLVELSHKSSIAQEVIRSNSHTIAHLFSLLDGAQPQVKSWVLKLTHCISDGHPDGVPLPPSHGKETAINSLIAILTHSVDVEERSLAAAIISQLPKDDTNIDDILQKSEALKAIREVIYSAEEENNGKKGPADVDASLLENALAALLRFTEPTKPELQRQVGQLELYPSLVGVLSRGSSLAKIRTAIALAHLSQSTSKSALDATNMAKQAKRSAPMLQVMNLFSNMSRCCSGSADDDDLCAVHGAACSPRHALCLIKADALPPLVKIMSGTESEVAEAALTALETLVADPATVSHASAAIVDSQGVVAILQVVEKGSVAGKSKAVELLHKIVKHTKISDALFQRTERILIQLLGDDTLKKKSALVLRQMKVIPAQSSYF